MSSPDKVYDLEQRYNVHAGTHRFTVPANQSHTLTSSQGGVGCSANLAAGVSYQFRGLLIMTFTSSGGTLSYRLHATGGLTAANFRSAVVEIYPNVAGGSIAGLDVVAGGSTVGTGLENRITVFDGAIVVGVAGTM